MSSFQSNYAWQLQFIPTIKNLVGPHLLAPAPFDVDANEATDILVLTARDMRIGCRIRRFGYADRYPYQFTLRSSLDTGTKTELAKIIDGWGDALFYGHAIEDDQIGINPWYLIDLDAWRAQMINSRKAAGRPEKRSNDDGTHFVAFDLRFFNPEPPICLASSSAIPQCEP